jgi:type I pantothenate kinase
MRPSTPTGPTTSFRASSRSSAYFHRYAHPADAEADATARHIWRTINGVNLRENILVTWDRARLVLEKGSDHAVRRIRLRRSRHQ